MEKRWVERCKYSKKRKIDNYGNKLQRWIKIKRYRAKKECKKRQREIT